MELINKEELLRKIDESPKNSLIRNTDLAQDLRRLYTNIIQLTPEIDAVPKKTYDFVKWERDVALSQLENYGVQLGEKADVERIVRCKDCQYAHKYSNTLRSIYCSMLERTMSIDSFCSFGEEDNNEK